MTTKFNATGKTTLRIFVETPKSLGYGEMQYAHVTAYPMGMNGEYWTGYQDGLTDRMKISCQMDTKSREPYGHEITFDDIDSESKAAIATRVFRAVKRELDKYYQRYGVREITFGEYIACVCYALNIKTVSMNHKGTWMNYSPGDAVWHINQAIKDIDWGDEKEEAS